MSCGSNFLSVTLRLHSSNQTPESLPRNSQRDPDDFKIARPLLDLACTSYCIKSIIASLYCIIHLYVFGLCSDVCGAGSLNLYVWIISFTSNRNVPSLTGCMQQRGLQPRSSSCPNPKPRPELEMVVKLTAGPCCI